MASPASCRYSESHEGFKVEGDLVVMGITQFAADELTDITYAEVKPVGTSVQPGGSVAEVESVKTASDVYSAVPGTIVEINEEVRKDPSLLNSDAFGRGWLCKIRASDTAPLQKLMDAAAYDRSHGH